MKTSPWKLKGAFVVGAGLLLTPLATAGLAWACVAATTAPFVTAPVPSRAPVGAAVAITGGNWAANTPLDLRWGSETGPLLAHPNADTRGAFATSIVVPAATSGSYLVLAVQPTRPSAATVIEIPAPQPTAQAHQDAAPAADTRPGVVTNRVSGGAGPAPIPATQTPPKAGLAPSAPPADPAPSGAAAPVPGPAQAGAATSTTGSALALPAPSASPGGPTSAAVPGVPEPAMASFWSGLSSRSGTPLRSPGLADLRSSSSSSPGGPAVPLAAVVGAFALAAGYALAEKQRGRATSEGRARRR